ncbi:pyruvate kinase [Nitratireductor sp. GISD-1A_MAKvit]|uniref:pyruvate kinase n=1 Tax=Nitratireductor sp. GISD-1A_MAKvit TaxID=3234198 RepID=UPI003466B70F
MNAEHSSRARTPCRISSKFTKILATLGPSTDSHAMILALHRAGADLYRLNFSHGSYETHQERHERVRAVEAELNTVIGILADLQGPKLRVGRFHDGCATLVEGQYFRLVKEPVVGNTEQVQLPHPEIFAVVESGDELLIDDGRIRFQVVKKGEGVLDCRVLNGGLLSDHKGVNLPSRRLNVSPLTKKDLRDLDFALSLGVDWIALSFVQHPDDVRQVKEQIAGRARLMAKIEKPSAVDHIEEIVELSDGIMIARGDLGVEMPPEKVPAIQKRIIEVARRHGRPVVVATQMLETMISAPVPTRAEASDVANAIYDGADAIMLSAETAVGKYPLEAVCMMTRIAHSIEQDEHFVRRMESRETDVSASDSDIIAAAACDVARRRGCPTIVTLTETGETAARVSRSRPGRPILALTPRASTARYLSVFHAVSPLQGQVEREASVDAVATEHVLAADLARPDDRIVITAGARRGESGGTNLLRIATVQAG